MRVIEHFVKALRDAAIFNPEVHVASRCLFWFGHHFLQAEQRAARAKQEKA
jgi:hypothetical protein